MMMLLVVCGLSPFTGQAQTIYNYTNASSGAPASVDPNATGDPISRGSGVSAMNLACTGLTEGFGATGWPTTNVFDVNAFNMAGDYFTFTVTPDLGYGLKITGFSARTRRENLSGTANDGPIAMRYAYSTNNGISWTSVNPLNPQSSNVCSSSGVQRVWPSFTTVNTTNPVIFRIYGLSSGSSGEGDFVLHDVVVSGEVCASVPSIAPAPDFFAVCAGETSVLYEYTTEEGDEYAIDYDAAAESAGFADIIRDVLDDAPNAISLVVPANAPAGTYNGTLTVLNNCGFSTEYDFSIEVRALPDVTLAVMPAEICAEQSVTLTFEDDAETGNFFTITADLVDDDGTTVGAINYSGIPDGASDVYTEGVDFNGDETGMASLTNIVVTDETTQCVNNSEADLSIVVNPLPDAAIAGDADICDGETATFTASGGVSYEWSTEEATASIEVSLAGTYTVTVTSAENCTATASVTLTVNPLPDAYLTVTPDEICPGSEIVVVFHEENYDSETEFTVSVDVSTPVNSLNTLTFNEVTDGDTLLILTEGVDFFGDLSFSNIEVTAIVEGCTSYSEGGPTVDVYDAPLFEFSAASTSDLGGTVNNNDGPASITVDFCAGNQLTLSAYSDNGQIGYNGSYTTSGNVTYDGGAPLGAGPVFFTLAPSNNGAFYNMVYGGALGYGLSSGTYGTISQTFTPYLDVNGNDSYDDGIDCLGDPITLNYHIYAPIVVNVAQLSDNDLCSGGSINYSFSTTSTENIVFDITVNQNSNGANPADLTDDNTFPITFPNAVANSAAPHSILQAINNAAGLFDRGRVSVSVSNVRYQNTDVACGTTINNPNPNTRIYPEPRLTPFTEDLLSCSGIPVEIDLTLEGDDSDNPANAGYPVQVDWTLSAPGFDEDGATGTAVVIYDNDGIDLSTADINQLLTLTNPGDGPMAATFSVTPRASGPSNGFNADDCYGQPILISVLVVPPPAPVISGPIVVHEGAQVQLTAVDNVTAPATLADTIWSSGNPALVTIDDQGIVTGIAAGGPVTIFYNVTDDAGCISTAEHVMNVLEPLQLTSFVDGSNEVACGDEITVEISVDNFQDITSLIYYIEYDETQFEYVSQTASVPASSTAGLLMPGLLSYEFFDAPTTLADGTVVFTYTLKAIGNSGPSNAFTFDATALNSFASNVPVTSVGTTLEIVPISLTIVDDELEICPGETSVNLNFTDVVGEPNKFFIDFDADAQLAGFPDTYQGTLVVGGGLISIPLPNLNGDNGVYTATLYVFNDESGCESEIYNFSLIVDQTPPTASNPLPVNVQCFDDVPAVDVTVVTDEADICPGAITVAFVGETNNGGAGCDLDPHVITRTYSVTDLAGNTIYVTQTITVEDDTQPTVSTSGMGLWFQTEAEAIDAAIAIANETKADNCSDPEDISVNEGLPVSYVGCQATVHLIVTDACGNAVNVNYTTVIDTENPSADIGLVDDCYEESEDEEAPYYPYQNAVDAALAATTFNDDCTDPEDLVITVEVDADSDPDCRVIIEVTATDACGKSTTVEYITRVDSQGPLISSEEDAMSGDCFTTLEDAVNAAIEATIVGDNCSSPSELQYDVFVEEGCPSSVTVFVTDYCGNPSMITYTNVYIDTESPTVLVDEGYPTCFKTEADALAGLFAVSNPEDNCSSYEELLELAEGTFYPYTDENACNSGRFVLEINDHCGNEPVELIFENIRIDNVAPTLVSFPELDAQYACLDEVPEPNEAGVVATDICSEEVTVTFIEDVPPADCPGVLLRTYQLTDDCGNTALVTQSINVVDDVAPTWVSPADDLDRTFACDDEDVSDAFLLEPIAEDNCGEVTLVKTTGDFVPGEDCVHEGTYTNTWVAMDDCGNASETVFTQVISVIDNVWPDVSFDCQFMGLELLTSEGAVCPSEAEFSLEVGDIVAADFNWSVAGVLIDNLEDCVSDNCSSLEEIQVEIVSIDVEDSETAGCSRQITVTSRIMDACGNAHPDLFVCQYLIIDDTAPTWDTQEGAPFPTGINIAVSCSDTEAMDFANSLEPAATDNCGGDVTITKTPGAFVPSLDCSSEGTYTHTFVATDACENTSTTFTQVISVFDNEAPTFDSECGLDLVLPMSMGAACPQNAVTSLEEGDVLTTADSWTVAGITINGFGECISDNCSDVADILMHVVNIENQYNTENCSRDITVTFQLEDACGNLQEETFDVTYRIIDDVAPLVFCYDNLGGGGPALPQSCYSSVEDAEADALEAIFPCDPDGCTAVEDLQIEVSTEGTCVAEVTVTVTDCAGNAATHTFVTRIDNEAPEMTPNLTTFCFETVSEAEAAALSGTLIEDNCDVYGNLDIEVSTVGTCPATITLTAIDDCGNANFIVYENICIGTSESIEITVEAADESADCADADAVLANWLSNNGGAEADGNGVQWSHSEVVFGAVDCMTHSKTASVTFTATDGCGHEASTTATFTVTDTEAPTAGAIAPSSLTCDSQIPAPNTGLVTGLDDNCDDALTVTLFANTSNGGAGCVGNPLVLLRTYAVTDDYCNTTYVTHTVTVIDNVAPTFTAPANITVNIDEDCEYSTDPSVTGDVTNEDDNCSEELNAAYTDMIVDGDMQAPVKFMIFRTWTLTDECGNAATPLVQVITVQDVILPTITCPAPVTQNGGTVESYPCAWVGTGLTPTYDDNCFPPTLTYELSGFFAGPASGEGSANGRVFLEGTTTVTYTVTDMVGNTAVCSFTVNVNCVTISGRIIWEHDDATGVNNTTVRLTQGMTLIQSVTTGTSGNYSLTPLSTGAHTIRPVKNTGPFNGVTTLDVYLIQQHLMSNPLITDPYKKVAADVNRTGFITAQDANILNAALMGDPSALAVFNVYWRFVPTAFTMPVTAPNVVATFPDNITVNVSGSDITGQDFYGIKIGDVNGTANPGVIPGGAPLAWMLKDEVLEAGKEYELTFAADGFNDLVAYQFALDFDPSDMQFLGYQSTDALSLTDENIGTHDVALGLLRLNWTGTEGTTLSQGAPVFKLKFKALSSGKRLSEVLQLSNETLEGLAFNEALAAGDVRLVFAAATDVADPAAFGKPQLQLMQNKPNPFTDVTMIGFVLPDACEAQLRVLDVSGRELANYTRDYTAGYHEIEFRMANAASYGVLYYELTTPFGKLSKKMITGGN